MVSIRYRTGAVTPRRPVQRPPWDHDGNWNGHRAYVTMQDSFLDFATDELRAVAGKDGH